MPEIHMPSPKIEPNYGYPHHLYSDIQARKVESGRRLGRLVEKIPEIFEEKILSQQQPLPHHHLI